MYSIFKTIMTKIYIKKCVKCVKAETFKNSSYKFLKSNKLLIDVVREEKQQFLIKLQHEGIINHAE